MPAGIRLRRAAARQRGRRGPHRPGPSCHRADEGAQPPGVVLVIAMGAAPPILSPAVCFYPITNAGGLLGVYDVRKAARPTALGQLVRILHDVFVIGSAFGFM